jgi:hypothetical protein
MPTTTPNFGWSVPVSTDLVKDGATAIELLGDSIDTSLVDLLGGTTGQLLAKASGTDLDFTWATPAAGGGITLVKTQTIGSAVSSVTVTDAFSTTYDSYQIIVSGGLCSADNNMGLKLGATTTGYYAGGTIVNYSGSAVTGLSDNNAAQWTRAGIGGTGAIGFSVSLQDPFLSKQTKVLSQYSAPNTTSQGGIFAGFLNDTTSYTDFTITPGTGTITGGTIRVYGYQNS